MAALPVWSSKSAPYVATLEQAVSLQTICECVAKSVQFGHHPEEAPFFDNDCGGHDFGNHALVAYAAR